MTVLITAASGRTSRYVLRALLASKQTTDIRLVVRSQASIDSIKQNFGPVLIDKIGGDRAFVTVPNMLDVDALAAACAGIDVVFYNGPGFVSDETALGKAMVDAAVRAGVKHFVFSQVLHPFLTKLINHIAKLPIQEYLTESGLNYTVLQPTSMMQNIDLSQAASHGILPAPYSPWVTQGFVDLADVAEVAAQVILDPESHNFAAYELVGHNISLDNVGSMLQSELGESEGDVKDVKVVKIPREKLVETFVAAKGLKGYQAVDAFERMHYYYDKQGIPGNSNTLRWLLNRDPTDWPRYIRRELKLKKPADFHTT